MINVHTAVARNNGHPVNLQMTATPSRCLLMGGVRLRRWIETPPQASRTIRYNANLQPSAETFPAAFFGGRILTRSYDSLNRPTGFELGTVSAPAADHRVTYGYDTAGRLATVQDPSRTWTYSFVPNTASLLSGVTSGNFSVAFTYEPGRNAINSVENKVGTTTVSRFTYTNNALGQRTARGQSGSAFAAAATESFGYNAKGKLISSTHSLDALRNTIFAYDGIGNRNEATFGGITTAYTANALNQYTEVDPGTPATPTYDEDGNMLSDGANKRLVWDGENRLVEVRNANDALIATYTYDGQSRRVKKVTTSLAPQGATEEVYVYDGWNRVATYQPASGSLQLVATATWGRDLSGTLEGAGGVGGLLGVKVGATSYRVTYDANGNVSEMIDSAGTIAAHYEYDPFGNFVVATGSYAAANPWRFSTKPVDAETAYSYYGYRFYNPETGSWVNRDPIGELGGVNIYAFLANRPISDIDKDGRIPPQVIGAGLGIVFDLTLQISFQRLSGSNWDEIKIDWSSVALSGAAGATGIGVGKVGANFNHYLKQLDRLEKQRSKLSKVIKTNPLKVERLKERVAKAKQGRDSALKASAQAVAAAAIVSAGKKLTNELINEVEESFGESAEDCEEFDGTLRMSFTVYVEQDAEVKQTVTPVNPAP